MKSEKSSAPEAGRSGADPWAPPDPGPDPDQPPRPPQDWHAEPPLPAAASGSNRFAIASLVTGLLCCVWPLALGFGITALIQLRRRGQRGKALAVAGVVLGGLGLCATVVGGVTALLLGGSVFGSVKVSALRTGQCFDRAPKLMTDRFLVVPCGQPHFGEVTGTTELFGDHFPGRDAVSTMAAKLCGTMTVSYAADPWGVPARLRRVHFAAGDQTAWDRDPHLAVCAFVDDSARMRGSLRFDSSTLTHDQNAYLDATRHLDWKSPTDSPGTDPAAWHDWAQQRVYGLTYALLELRARTWPGGTAPAMEDLERALQRELDSAKAVLAWPPTGAERDAKVADAQATPSLEDQAAVRQLLSLRTRPS
ncbi:DUF4190 domain-containing protein [Kitasatospora kazusensis]|uniref:DUF4190 domain-containing protein n=1 Tax=Kitasatospora kazusensis TaxID=407974 RepID=UPI0031E12F87